jgi:hypothetical protein
MDLVNPKQGPTFLPLSTIASTGVPGVNSMTTFALSTPISTATDQGFGRVALHAMSGTHSILNIPRDITFTISSTWFNESSNSEESGIVDVNIPRGNYNYETMLALLNSELSVFADEPYPDTVYGFGGTPTLVDPPENIPVASMTTNSKFVVKQYANLLDQEFAGTVNEHVYLRFTIIGSVEVYRLFVMLGFTYIQNVTSVTQNIASFTINISVSSRVYDGTNTIMTYNVENEIVAPYSYNFSGVQALYINLMSGVNSQFRSPFTNNAPSNLIMRVPLNVPFGFQFNYTAQNLVWTQQKNMTISNLQVYVTDEFNETVDFQNLPWFLDLAVMFAVSEEDLNVSGTEGVPQSIPSAPEKHFSQLGYNAVRDPFASASQNNKRKKNG